MEKINKMLKDIQSTYEKISQSSNTNVYWRLSTILQDLDSELREFIQKQTQKEVEEVINKLKAGVHLSEQELKYVKLWLVGDADYYVKYENNYNDWLEELKRLVEQLQAHQTKECDIMQASKLRAMSLDAIRVIGDIIFFVKQQERIRNFNESTKSIDSGERDLLIRLLQGKSISPNE